MSKAAVDLKFKAEGRCRLCLRPSWVRPLTRHRLVPGSAGGTYIAVNCIPLCRPCHDLVDNRDRRSKQSARRMLRAALWPIEISYAYRRSDRVARQVELLHPSDGWITALGPPTVGRGWSFDRQYPRPTRELVIQSRARQQYRSSG